MPTIKTASSPVTGYQQQNAHSGLIMMDGSYYEPAALNGTFICTSAHPSLMKLDPGGANRDVTLDDIEDAAGMHRIIANGADAAENLVVKNPAGSTIGTINQNEMGRFYCDGTTWSLVYIQTIALS